MPVTEVAAPRREIFRAMGTLVRVIGPSSADRFDQGVREAEETFARAEDRFSRFLEESELSMVNRRAGRWTPVSPGFMALVRTALGGARETDGLFDPTVLPALIAAGYDRDFDAIVAEARAVLHASTPCGRWRDVRIDGDALLLPAGAALDFGGIAKGWAVDLTVRAVGSLLPWCLIDAGGDMRAAGDIEDGGLDIAVEAPFDATREVMRLRLQRGALATSSITKRSWGPGLHHVIDPRNGRSADTGVLQATAWAPTCAEAEIRATWALLAGRPVLDRVPGALVLADGRIVTSMRFDTS